MLRKISPIKMTDDTPKIRTRFAPSPTGFLHIGSARTALFAYLFARHHDGDLVLRVEDTDQARFVEGATTHLIATLGRLGISYDEGLYVEGGKLVSRGDHGPYLQSERKELYAKHAQQLIDSGHRTAASATASALTSCAESKKRLSGRRSTTAAAATSRQKKSQRT